MMNYTATKKTLSRILAYVLLACLFVGLLPAGAAAASDGQPDVIVASGGSGYKCHFPDVRKTSDGLIAAYYYNTSHAPYSLGNSLGRIYMVRGSADGKTWAAPELFISPEKLADWGLGIWNSGGTLYYNEDKTSYPDTPYYYYSGSEKVRTAALPSDAQLVIESRDPNFARMNDGTLLFTFFTRLPSAATVNGQTFQNNGYYTWGRTYIMYSRDDGETWSAPTEIPSTYLNKGAAKRGDIAIYSDGSILIPLYGFSSSCGGTFTTANVAARLNSDGTWSFTNEYSTHSFEGTAKNGAFRLADTEVSFGVTEDDVTYALCRSSGDFLVSYDKGASWTLLSNQKAISGVDTQQPSFCLLNDGSGRFFVTWSESHSGKGRCVWGKIFDPAEGWTATEAQLLYMDSRSGDMADPTGIQLNNGQLFTIFYDTYIPAIGGVFHSVDELTATNAPVDSTLPDYTIFEEDFEDYNTGVMWNKDLNPAVEYHTWQAMSSVAAEGSGEIGNKYLRMSAPYEASGNKNINSTRFTISTPLSGDGSFQFDYRFETKADTFQAIYVRPDNTSTGTAEGAQYVIQIRQDDANGGNYIRLMGSGGTTILDTAYDAFEIGETYTFKFWRIGTTLYIKNWKAGTAEPENTLMSFSSPTMRTTGYVGFVYQCNDIDGTHDSNPTGVNYLYVDNFNLSRNYSLSLNRSILTAFEGSADAQLTATLDPEDSSAVIQWSSSDDAVASVDSTGKVTYNGVGKAVITASCGKLSAECAVTVLELSDEFKDDLTTWYYIDKDFEDNAIGNYVADDPDFIFSMRQNGDASDTAIVSADGSNVLKMVGGPISSGRATRLLAAGTGDLTLTFDFKMPFTASGSNWQSVYLMVGNAPNNSFQLRQWVLNGEDSGKIRYVNGAGDLLDVYTALDAEPVQKVFTDVFETGEDAPWYSVKVVRTGNRVYIKLWEKDTDEPDAFQYIIEAEALRGNGIQIAYQAVSPEPQYLLLDNLVVSKNTEMTISDTALAGKPTQTAQLNVTFDRDVSGETPTPQVVWTSSDEKVAIVDQTGKVTYTGAGEAVITAALDNLTQTCAVTVTDDSTITSIHSPEAALTAQSETIFTASVPYETSSIHLNITTGDPDASVTIDGNPYTGQALSLTAGQQNTIRIRVDSSAGTSTTWYTVVIYRAQKGETPIVIQPDPDPTLPYVFPFTDVTKDKWYYNDVAAAHKLGLIDGMTDTTFVPEGEMTLAQAITLAARMHCSATAGGTLENGDPWYQTYVDYCLVHGILDKAPTAEALNAPVTRAQYAELFAKALPASMLPAVNDIPDNSIPDVKMTHRNAAAIYTLYRAGILDGRDDYGRFDPDETITRAEIAAILVRMMDTTARVPAPSLLGR